MGEQAVLAHGNRGKTDPVLFANLPLEEVICAEGNAVFRLCFRRFIVEKPFPEAYRVGKSAGDADLAKAEAYDIGVMLPEFGNQRIC